MVLIKTEIIDGFKVSKSKNGFKIRKVGTNEIYIEAWDLIDSVFEYEETGTPIEQQETNIKE